MKFLVAVWAIFLALTANAQPILDRAKPYLPILKTAQVELWPTMPQPSILAGQVEKESLWRPRATLRTSREWGAGFSQCTAAYRADGSLRFDRCEELKQRHAELEGWDDRYDPVYQLKAVVLFDRDTYGRIPLSATGKDAIAFMLSAYNGGETGLMQDIALCRRKPGCDPTRWWGHVALDSTKSRVKWKGYGASAFEINRTYVDNIFQRSVKYVPYMEP